MLIPFIKTGSQRLALFVSRTLKLILRRVNRLRVQTVNTGKCTIHYSSLGQVFILQCISISVIVMPLVKSSVTYTYTKARKCWLYHLFQSLFSNILVFDRDVVVLER